MKPKCKSLAHMCMRIGSVYVMENHVVDMFIACNIHVCTCQPYGKRRMLEELLPSLNFRLLIAFSGSFEGSMNETKLTTLAQEDTTISIAS